MRNAIESADRMIEFLRSRYAKIQKFIAQGNLAAAAMWAKDLRAEALTYRDTRRTWDGLTLRDVAQVYPAQAEQIEAAFRDLFAKIPAELLAPRARRSKEEEILGR